MAQVQCCVRQVHLISHCIAIPNDRAFKGVAWRRISGVRSIGSGITYLNLQVMTKIPFGRQYFRHLIGESGHFTVMRHVIECGHIRSALQATTKLHLLDGRYFELTMMDIGTTAGCRTAVVCRPALCPILSINISDIFPYSNLELIAKFYLGGDTEFAVDILQNDIWRHMEIRRNQMPSYVDPHIWLITITGVWASMSLVEEKYTLRTRTGILKFTYYECFRHGHMSRHFGQYLSHMRFEWTVSGGHWYATIALIVYCWWVQYEFLVANFVECQG